jgi:hypothetical protein
MRLARRAWTPAALVCLAVFGGALPAAADAGYAPALSVQLNPPVAGQVPEIMAVLTQTPYEPATRRFTLRFPPGFIVNRSLAVAPCQAGDLAAHACPAASRIGRIDAQGSGGAVSGPLFLTRASGGTAAIGGFLSGAGLAFNRVIGSFRPAIGDGLDISLEGLPPVPLTSLAVILDGGDLGLVRTPPECGSWNLTGDFTSWQLDFAVAMAPVSASLCQAEPVLLSRVRVSRRSFRPARTFADARRAGVGTLLSWRLSRPTSATRVAVERLAGGVWQRVGSVIGSGDAGLNWLVFDGRLRGRALRPGAYRFLLIARGGAAAARARFTVTR